MGRDVHKIAGLHLGHAILELQPRRSLQDDHRYPEQDDALSRSRNVFLLKFLVAELVNALHLIQ